MTSPEFDLLLADLRERAGRRDWSGVRTLAAGAGTEFTIEFGLIVSEADLRQGDTISAKARLLRVVQLAERRHDAAALTKAVNMLGGAWFEQGDLGAAESAFERATTEADLIQDHLTRARATNNLGLIANVRGRHEEALALYRVALPAYQRLGHAAGMGETSHNLAITLRDLGQLDEADRYERRAIEFATEGHNIRLTAMARAGRADISLRRGEAAVAAADARRAVVEYREMGDAMGEADALRTLGLACLALEDRAQAETAISNALELATQSGATLIQAECLAARARLAVAVGTRDLAHSAYLQAIGLFESLGAHLDRDQLAQWWDETTQG